MNRELKFRTPCKCHSGKHHAWILYGLTSGEIINARIFRSDDCSSSECGYGTKQFAPDEQWTGLKDRDGVDIYEGDIVTTVTGLIRVIVFRDGAFHSQVPNWQDGKDMPNHPVYFWSLNADLSPKVIGNVHQNPELLGVKL